MLIVAYICWVIVAYGLLNFLLHDRPFNSRGPISDRLWALSGALLVPFGMGILLGAWTETGRYGRRRFGWRL